MAGVSRTNTGITPEVVVTQDNKQELIPAKPALPNIDIFMTQRCSIPLIRCDYESALKAANIHREGTTDVTPQKDDDTLKKPIDNERTVAKQPELRTSNRPCTVINYQQFADTPPPSPPKKKRGMDLKHKPSKERIAADKYKSKFVTKPTHLPKPVRNKDERKKLETAPKGPHSCEPTPDPPSMPSTVLTPATSSKTRDTIEALLMLVDLPVTDSNQPLEDDNVLLVPIIGTASAQDTENSVNPVELINGDLRNMDPTVTGNTTSQDNEKQTTNVDDTDHNTTAKPLLGTVLSTAIKQDMDTGDAGPEETGDKPGSVKKELSIKEYGIKWKYKLDHKFKCKLCPAKLSSVQEYNKHHLDNHLPLPSLDCTRVFVSPRTLAKHRYTHADYMFECQDCGCGFIFKSQLDSRRKVHLKMSGFICFKPKCGKWFKRESGLNVHLITHSKKKIKCDYCDYSNADIRNVRAHSKVHSDKLPYHCPLCQKGFKWQEQKCRHLKTCEGD